MKGFALWNSEMACNQSIRNNGENTRIIYFFFLVFFLFLFFLTNWSRQKKARQIKLDGGNYIIKTKTVITLQ